MRKHTAFGSDFVIERAAVRVLSIETSSPRGSVALIEGENLVAAQCHQAPTTRAETTLDLVDQLFAASGWARSSIGLVAVGIGPGSFTGLRVGIAIAQGIAIGLGLPICGVNSLRAMAAGVPESDPRIRCAMLDARRDEVFLAAYDHAANEVIAPQTVARGAALGFARQHVAGPLVILGAVARELGSSSDLFESELTDLPHAACVGREAIRLGTTEATVTPLYVRGADALLPKLPASPLELPRTR